MKSNGETRREVPLGCLKRSGPKICLISSFMSLGCSKRAIWSLLSLFCSGYFTTFPPSYWGALSYYPRRPIARKGNSLNSKIGWDRGDLVPGAFKLDHWQSGKPLLFWRFFNFSTFILGSPILLPQRANDGKRPFTQLQNWIRQGSLGAWGIQTGPFALH